MTRIAIALTLVSILTQPVAAHESATGKQWKKIEAALEDAGCEAARDDVLEHEGHFEIVPVTCADGSYFVEIDGNFEIVKKIKQ